MSLYPSLEDMKLDNMTRAQMACYGQPQNVPSAPVQTDVYNGQSVYPSLGNYMGLELSQDVIAINMPEYAVQPVMSGGAVSTLTAPLSAQSNTLAKATVTQAIRQVVLCKDRNGRIGLRLHSIDEGVFVCFVEAGSPAALGGLRFGDQILEINNVIVAGMSMDKCHNILQKAPVNGICMSIRDRPFERTVTLHKDSVGHVGFHLKNGKIIGLVKDSSAARNGLLINHQLVEVNTVNVTGMKDKDIYKLMEQSPSVVNITILPEYIYKHMLSKMRSSLLRDMDRTPAV